MASATALGNDRTGYASVVDVLKRDNYTVDKIVLAQIAGRRSGRCVGADHRGTDGRLLEARGRRDQNVPAQGRQGALHARSRRSASPRAPCRRSKALLKEWGITLGHDVVIDISGMGQLLGTDASVPVVASYPQHPVTENFDLLTAFPLAQSVKGEAGVELGHGEHAERASTRATEAGRSPT